jgi:transposase-like protein
LFYTVLVYLQLIQMNCPRCGKVAHPTGKKWKFSGFDVEQQKCSGCSKTFSAYYKDGKFRHTVPKAKK